jgi:hypothetical protein
MESPTLVSRSYPFSKFDATNRVPYDQHSTKSFDSTYPVPVVRRPIHDFDNTPKCKSSLSSVPSPRTSITHFEPKLERGKQFPLSRLRRPSEIKVVPEETNPTVSILYTSTDLKAESECQQQSTPRQELSLYKQITPDSPVWGLYSHTKEYVPAILPLIHRSIYDINLIEYPHTNCDPRTPRSELFWNLWSNADPDLSPIQLYKLALEHGVRVSYRVKTIEAKAALPHRWYKTMESVPPYIRNPFYQEFTFVDDDPDTLNTTYLFTVKELLTREHARGFLERGGLAWRIALEFGPPGLWAEAFKGPSLSVVRFYEGELILDKEGDWICEQTLKREIQLLVGQVYVTEAAEKVRKSLFPPLNVFESSMHWNGIWTDENEKWFNTLVGRLRQKRLKPRTGHNWDKWARSNAKHIQDEDALRWNLEFEESTRSPST